MLLQIQLPESYLPILQRLTEMYGSRTAGIKVLLDTLAGVSQESRTGPDALRRAREADIAAGLMKTWHQRCWANADCVYSTEDEAVTRQLEREASADTLLCAEYRAAQYARRLSVPTLRELCKNRHKLETAADTVLNVLRELAPEVGDYYGDRSFGVFVGGCYRPRPAQ